MTDTYVAIDLETTGLDPKKEKIIEIGAVKVVDGQVAEEFSTLVDPRRLLEERISELTGITDDDVRRRRAFRRAVYRRGHRAGGRVYRGFAASGAPDFI